MLTPRRPPWYRRADFGSFARASRLGRACHEGYSEYERSFDFGDRAVQLANEAKIKAQRVKSGESVVRDENIAAPTDMVDEEGNPIDEKGNPIKKADEPEADAPEADAKADTKAKGKAKAGGGAK